MSNLRPPIPPVLSRQIARPIALPTRAVPLKHIPLISNAGHAQAPVRLAGGPGLSSPRIPSHADIMSTVQQTQSPASNPTNPIPSILSDGTYEIGGIGQPTRTPLAHISFDRPMPCTIYVAIKPGTAISNQGAFVPQGTFTLLVTVRFGRGRGATRLNFDLPMVGPIINGAWVRSPILAIPVNAQDVDVAARFAPFGGGLTAAEWAPFLPTAAQDNIFDDPPDIPPGLGPVATIAITAWIAESESTPRRLFPMRKMSTTLGAGNSIDIPVCTGAEACRLTADPTLGTTFAFIQPGPSTIGNLPANANEPFPIPNDCHRIVVSTTSTSVFELVQYASL
jgi:hypothetical protein